MPKELNLINKKLKKRPLVLHLNNSSFCAPKTADIMSSNVFVAKWT